MKKQFTHVTPEQVGISSESILEFLRRAKEACIEMHSLTVMRHGKICAQGWWAPYRADIPHAMYSFSKTLTAIAIGFAEQEGILTLDEKLIDIFPDESPAEPGENLRKADIYSLLTMSCGHENDPGMKNHGSPDWIRNFLHYEFKYEPGTMFQYNTTGTDMLSAIITKKTGLTLTQYLKPRLFDRIGMTDAHCSAAADGVIQRGGSGFLLTNDDMTRVSQFLLQKGKWEGEQILNADWVERASAKQISTVNPVFDNHSSNWQLGYGFQMWRCVPEGVFRADGAFGQFGIIIPNKDAVIAINSAHTNADVLLNIVWDTVLKGMSDTETLPENAAVSTELKRVTDSLSLPAPWGVRSSAGEKEYGGQLYRTEQELPGLYDYIGGHSREKQDENGGMREIRFDFNEKTAVLTAGKDGDVQKLTISLTGEPMTEEIDGLHFSAAGYWQSARRFMFEARCVENAIGARIVIDFTKDTLTFTCAPTIPFGIDGDPDTVTFTK